EVPQVRGAALGRGPGEAGGTCLEAAVDAGGDDGVHRWPPSSLFVFWSALQDARQLLDEGLGGLGLSLDELLQLTILALAGHLAVRRCGRRFTPDVLLHMEELMRPPLGHGTFPPRTSSWVGRFRLADRCSPRPGPCLKRCCRLSDGRSPTQAPRPKVGGSRYTRWACRRPRSSSSGPQRSPGPRRSSRTGGCS